MKPTNDIDRKLQAQLLLARRVDNDRLMLADAVLLAALEGSRPLTHNEAAALEASPLTLRRFRQLSLERRARPAANDANWSGSRGLLRAASGVAALESLTTDDGYWTLDFLSQGDGWQVIIKLTPAAPFAARLMREHALLRVVDGSGSVILQGRLDVDGECETGWPFASAPAAHFQQRGASFIVEPVQA